jgi:hypothetical protein
MRTKGQLGVAQKSQTDMCWDTQMTPLTGLVGNRHHGDATAMREDSLILIEDKRRDARGQYAPLFLRRVEHVFCRGHLIEERSGSALSFFLLRRRCFFSAVECGGVLSDLHLHGTEFLLYCSLTRFQDHDLSLDVRFRLSSTATMLTTLFRSYLVSDLITLRGECVTRLCRRRDGIAAGLPITRVGERLLF